MDEKKRTTAFSLLGMVRAIGLRTSLDSAVYDVVRRRQAARFAAPETQPGPWQSPSELNAFKADQTGAEFHSDSGSLRVDVVGEQCFRVRFAPDGQFAPLFSYAVVERRDTQPVPFSIVETDTAIEVRAEHLAAEIGRDDLSVRITTPEGRVVCEDAGGIAWRGKAVRHSVLLAKAEAGHGLGERAFGLNLRGRTYGLWNTDPAGYAPGVDPINLCIPFYVGQDGQGARGIFWDNPSRGTIAVGAAGAEDELVFSAESGELCYYVFPGPTLNDVVEQYTALTGRMPMPPLWTLGYQQCRWSYMSADEVRGIAAEFRRRQIPCDALYLDIDYMDGFRCFTWNPRTFPEPERLTADLAAQGFRTVVMIDPGIKQDHAYAVCKSGLQEDVFLKYPDGSLFVAPVWPGNCYFPDFTSARVRAWWGEWYRGMLDKGVAGFWNDMGEPAIFCMAGADKNVPDFVPHDWDGRGATHLEAHNVYGMQMGRATREGLEALQPDRRHLVIVRAGYAGVQRYASSWTADNLSTWDHLRVTIGMCLNLGLSGLAFTGPDIGGFGGNADGELFARWIQLATLLPFFRGHTAKGTIPHEPWAFGQPYEDINRRYIGLRYRFLPYLYTAMAECATYGWPIIRPTKILDAAVGDCDDTYLLRDGVLVAPVVQQGADRRQVRLPAGGWYDYWTGQPVKGGETIEVTAPLEHLPLYVRAGTVLPHWPAMQYTGERPVDELELRVYHGEGESTLYEDAGEGKAYQAGAYRWSRFFCQPSAAGLSVRWEIAGDFQPEYRRARVLVYGLAARPASVLVDDRRIEDWDWQDGVLTVSCAPFASLVVNG